MRLYTRSGRRRVLPPIVFGAGVLWHLLRHGREYDVVHTASFPYFSVLAAAAARRARRFRLVVDWHEVWTRDYWREYAGALLGTFGWLVQRACLRLPNRSFCFSKLHESRLREEGLVGELTRLEGQWEGPLDRPQPRAADAVVVFAGRHIPEKRVAALVPALARAREQIRELRGEIFGDGPERPAVLRAIADLGLEDSVAAPGFVEADRLEHALGRALCLALPSRREGYGRVVVEAAARGVPSLVVTGPDNAAAELVEDGVNGVLVSSAAPDELAGGIVKIWRAGDELRESTADWFQRNAERLSLDRSLRAVLEAYSEVDAS